MPKISDFEWLWDAHICVNSWLLSLFIRFVYPIYPDWIILDPFGTSQKKIEVAWHQVKERISSIFSHPMRYNVLCEFHRGMNILGMLWHYPVGSEKSLVKRIILWGIKIIPSFSNHRYLGILRPTCTCITNKMSIPINGGIVNIFL